MTEIVKHYPGPLTLSFGSESFLTDLTFVTIFVALGGWAAYCGYKAGYRDGSKDSQKKLTTNQENCD